MPGRGVGAGSPPGAGATAQRQPHQVGHAAAAGGGRRRVDAGHGGVVPSRPVTASSSAEAGTPACTSSTSVSSTWAVSDSVEVSVTREDRLAGRHRATLGEHRVDRASRRRRPRAGRRPVPAGSPAAGRAAPAVASEPCPAGGGDSETVPATGARTVRAATDAAGDVEGCPGLHPLGRRQRRDSVGEAAEPGRELTDRLVGAGPGRGVLRLRRPAGRTAPGSGPARAGCAGRPGGRGRTRAAPRRRPAGRRPGRPARCPAYRRWLLGHRPAAPDAAVAGCPVTRPAAAPCRHGPAGPRAPGAGRRCRQPAS